ncbi:hypothetical protein ABH940_007213 [Streptacidiphilus sp. BW17]|jgi:hypothetical protein
MWGPHRRRDVQVTPVPKVYASASCCAASLRALSRERRAGAYQPQLQWATANAPFSVTDVSCELACCVGMAGPVVLVTRQR